MERVLLSIAEYSLKKLREDEEFIWYRGVHAMEDPSQRSILVLSPARTRPALATITKMEHEFALKDDLHSAWAIKPVSFAKDNGRMMLVFEDPSAEPLDQICRRPMEVTEFLRCGISLAAGLEQVHRRGLIHKDIKPSTALVNTAMDRAWLTGFGIASRLPRERQRAHPPESIAGTLAYMAPEQTGRMNRSIDSRSDLYSLGVTLYEMLTGSLPFTASDPMEWVHCHIAKQPLAPVERLPIPLPVSAIIMKLLAKAPEERYQTAAGAENDLRRCFDDLKRENRIYHFRLGEHDRPDRLQISEKLYGREREIGTLLTAFDRVVQSGTPELVLVSGYSGIGKSSVVNELHRVLVPPRGLFASGKFDQYKRDIPYSTLAQALEGLIRGLLAKSEAELAAWREALLVGLGFNAQLIIDLVPGLKAIIGEQPAVSELPTQDAQRRFQLTLRRFISVFARAEHPLALFLDDLQWLDSATLEVLDDLLTQPDVEHLLIIGAYRDNEVDREHPLSRKITELRKTAIRINEITLAALKKEDVVQLMSDTLLSEPEAVLPLAESVYDKTAGNPFFTIQFFSALEREGLLSFEYLQGRWFWDTTRIQAKGYTDNVVDLVIERLQRLTTETQRALQKFACIGNAAGISTLSVVYEKEEDQVHAGFFEALHAELIERQDGQYRFIHDRVQEAAYSLMPETERPTAHLRLGRLLLAHTPHDRREETIFEIVNQLNRGAALITSREEKEQLAELNLIAGKRAKNSTAYVSALKYLVAGAELLADDAWDRRPELTFALGLCRAECEFLTGALADAEARLTMLSSRAVDPMDASAVACLSMDLYTSLSRSDSAVQICLSFLRQRGIECTLHPTEEVVRQEYERMRALVGHRTIEELLNSPLMTDRASIATMDVLIKALSPASFIGANLFNLIVLRMINLSLEQGNTDASCEAYNQLSKFGGPRFASYKQIFEFGRLGYELVERRGLKRFLARTYNCYALYTLHSTKHPRLARDLFRGAFDVAVRIGEFPYAMYAWYHLTSNLLVAGDPLAEVQASAEQGLEFALRAHFSLMADTVTTQLCIVRTLRGFTTGFGRFDTSEFDEVQFERRLANPRSEFAAYWYWTRKLQARYFAADYEGALHASKTAQSLLWLATSWLDACEWFFFSALSHAGAYDAALPAARDQHREILTTLNQQLAEWADNCSELFKTRAALVAAEIARVEGRALDAEQLYEDAIKSARVNEFVSHEALANELAARFYASRNLSKIAATYLRDARYCYALWGADGKVRQLDRLWPDLKKEGPGTEPTSSIMAAPELLDLATVIKVSQALSGEVNPDNLIDKVLRCSIEQAGAARGLLVLPSGDELYVQAEATAAGNDIIVVLNSSSFVQGALPESLIRYVIRTQENVILGDASSSMPFCTDPYIAQRRTRSVLCVPLIHQGKLTSVLYLENDLTPHSFTVEKISVLKVIASQAAISLENMRLYRDLENREAKIRRLVEADIIGIFTIDFDGQITEANDAFLRILGYERDDLISGRMHWRTNLTPPEWHAADEERFRKLKQFGRLEPFEKEYFRKDGTRVPVMIGVARLEENANRAIVFALDMTEQKRVERALRRSESELHEAQRLSHTGSWRLDPVSGTVTCSPEISRIFVVTPEEDTSSPDFWFGRIHPEDRARARENFERCFAEKVDYEDNYRIVVPDGSIKYVHSIGHPTLNDCGSLVEFLGTVIDITEQVRARVRLEQAFEEIRGYQEQLYRENLVLKEEVDQASMFEEIVGTSKALRPVLTGISKVATSDSTVLITGETGTGKELIARAIHKRSARARRAFVSVNCAALPPSLISSELFGHEKGAFTGALQRRLGRFELADGGTLFLDEIGDLPPDMQVALLRVLQEREFERVGGSHPIRVNVRVIAATNRDLKSAVADGAFRNDLYYRLNVFPIEVPSLRERKEDIMMLVEYFVNRFASRAGKTIRSIDKKTRERLQSYDWPGNIRELQNIVERAIILSSSDVLSVDQSWFQLERDVTSRMSQTPAPLDKYHRERETIEAALAECRGRVSGPSGAALKLRIPSSTLESRIKALGINKSNFKFD